MATCAAGCTAATSSGRKHGNLLIPGQSIGGCTANRRGIMARRLVTLFFLSCFPAGVWWVLFPQQATALPVTYTVCANGCDFTAVQTAVDASEAGDTLVLADETFVENVLIDKSITLTGEEGTVLDGNGAGGVMTVTDGVTVKIQVLMVTNGRSDFGGGIENLGTLLLDSVVISGNLANLEGGGIDNFGGHLTIVNSLIQGNIAHSGGGISSDTMLTLSHSLITHNRATEAGGGLYNYEHGYILNSSLVENLVTGQGSGGGIYNEGNLSLVGTLVQENSTVWGGGIFNEYLLTVTHSALIANAAAYGAGVYNDNTAVLSQTSLFSNTASFNGGGLFNQDTLTLSLNTLAANFAAAAGGGVFNDGHFYFTNTTLSGNLAGDGGGVYNSGHITSNNVTVADNFALVGGGVFNAAGQVVLQNTLLSHPADSHNCSGLITSLGYNLSSDGSCGLTAVGDLNHTPLLLGPLQLNGGTTQTHALLPTSPAINAGSPSSCEAVDQRGLPRPIGPRCDSGAYETQMLTTFLPLIQNQLMGDSE